MRIAFFVLISLLITIKTTAQETTALKLQMRNLKNEIVSDNISLKVDDKNPVNKFGDNIYEFKIPTVASEVKIEITGSEFKIFYPLNNKLLIPKNTNKVIEILVATNKDYGTLISIYPLIKKLQIENAAPEKYCKTALKLMEEIKLLKTDSVIQNIKRDSVFNQICPIFNQYINAAFDLKKLLHSFDSIYFNNDKAIAYLDTQITNYSNTWKKFYFSKDGFEKAIDMYWDNNTNLKSRLNNTIRDIERIHKIFYYAQLNDILDEFNRIPTTAINKNERIIKYKSSLQKFKNFSDNSILTEELILLEKNINALKFEVN